MCALASENVQEKFCRLYKTRVMESNYTLALEQAIFWINDNYKPVGIVVSGSIIRGNPNANSDFDIYVIHQENFRQRIQKYFNQVPCEIFLNSYAHAYKSLEEELKMNRPVTANMISTGTIYKGNENPDFLKLIEAAKSHSGQSSKLTEQQILSSNYGIATLFEDATDILEADEATAEYILNKAVSDAIDLCFRNSQTPQPRIKERLKVLSHVHPAIGAFATKYYCANQTKEKYIIARQILNLLNCETGFFEWSSSREQ